MIRYLIASLLISFSLNAEIIDTGNILTNSTFGTGTTYNTTGWTVDEHTHGHHGTGSFATLGGGNNPGGSVAAEENTSIEQTITLSEKTNMTTQEIQNGWSSTISADIWYWNQYNNTTTLKQTITGSDGSSSTQQRIIQDTGCGSINCGSFTNYTDTHIQGSNTQTDFDIKVGVTNTNNRSGHWGPDIDDVQLKVQYTYINPLEEDTQEIIDDIGEDIENVIEDIPEDIEFEQEFTWEDNYFNWEEEFYFEEETDWASDFYIPFEDIETTFIEDLSSMDEFEEIDFEEMPIIEEVFFEEEYMMEPPPMMMEEIFTEEFEEDFIDFIAETGMEEEFIEFLEDEGITAEEFFEEIAEEEFNEEPTTESFEEFEEVETIEESPSEIVTNEEGAMEEIAESNPELEEESEVANNEQIEEAQEDESDSETAEESDVSTEESGEQEDVQSEDRELDTEDRITTDVARVETKLAKNLKKIAKDIAKVTKINTQTLSKEDIFFKNNNTLNAYLKTNFYKSKDIYTDTNLDLFNQVNLGVYNKDIYTTITLASYINNDPVEIHNKKLQEINIEKRKLMIELEALKNE